MIDFEKCEIDVLISLLEDLKNEQGNAGCNDFFLEKTPSNIEFAKIYNKSQSEDLKLNIKKERITGYDIAITHYFIEKLKKLQ